MYFQKLVISVEVSTQWKNGSNTYYILQSIFLLLFACCVLLPNVPPLSDHRGAGTRNVSDQYSFICWKVMIHVQDQTNKLPLVALIDPFQMIITSDKILKDSFDVIRRFFWCYSCSYYKVHHLCKYWQMQYFVRGLCY